jgi:opacity protein-like surface antigen
LDPNATEAGFYPGLSCSNIYAMKKTLLALVVSLCLTFAASAADFSGKWVRDPSAPAPAAGGGRRGGGGRGGAYTFKVDGTTLTGSVAGGGRNGATETPIADGKVTGDTFTFSVTRNGRGGTPTKTVYTGKVISGDKLEITSDNGNGPVVIPLVKAP